MRQNDKEFEANNQNHPNETTRVLRLSTTNPNRTVLYVGMTNDIGRRMVEHYANRGKKETFAGRYYCYCLVYLELYQYVNNAIEREKEVKDWRRELKDELIAGFNPKWKFLNAEWCGEWPPKVIWGDYYRAKRNASQPDETG